ncbi:MAG: hypothetical protein R3B47_15270 [Bacteroidia bacterium]
MKYFFPFILFLAACGQPAAEKAASIVINEDIPRFWQAYDAIRATNDSSSQYSLLDSLYIRPATPGLKAFMERRQYRPQDFIHAINAYPRFWESVRENTLNSAKYAGAIEADVVRLHGLYPALKPAKIYFTIGALMSGGTTLDDKVLIGAEIAMGDTKVVTEELPEWLSANLSRHFSNNPVNDVVLLNLHEYVHTQQKRHGYDLLSQSLYEGVAEFVSVTAAEKPSTAPAVNYGKANDARIRARFVTEMFSPNWDDWLYNNFRNEFEVRDLGYYVGYAICEHYYTEAANKQQAIAKLIELDFGDKTAVEAFVDSTGYFLKPISEMRKAYEASVPTVIRIEPFDHNEKPEPGRQRITVHFSRPMNPRFRGFDFGPLGQEHVLPVDEFIGFSDDSLSISFFTMIEKGKTQQLTLSNRFRTAAGVALVPYLIEVK